MTSASLINSKWPIPQRNRPFDFQIFFIYTLRIDSGSAGTFF